MTKKTKDVRDVRQEMLLDDDVGPLYIDESLKDEGYVYRIVDSSRIGRVQALMKKGYEVVHVDNAQVGSNSVSNTSSLSTALTVELGRLTSVTGIVMRIPQDLYEKRVGAKRARNQEVLASCGKTGIATQFGEVIIGNETFKQ